MTKVEMSKFSIWIIFIAVVAMLTLVVSTKIISQGKEISGQMYDNIRLSVKTDLHRSYIKQFLSDQKISFYEYERFSKILKKEREEKELFEKKQNLINSLIKENKDGNKK